MVSFIMDLFIAAMPVAIIFSFVYFLEMCLFLRSLESESPVFWVSLGSPTAGRATRSVALPILFGKFGGIDSLNRKQRQRMNRLRIYLVGLLFFYAFWLGLVAFRRQLGWHT